MSARPSNQLTGMNDAEASLQEDFIKAINIVNRLDSGELFALSREYRLLHAEALELMIKCLMRVDDLGLFSHNELEDDVPTQQLKYFNLSYYVAKLVERTPIDASRTSVDARISSSHLAARKYVEFIFTLQEYGMLPPTSATLDLETVLPNGVRGSFNLSLLVRNRPSRKAKVDFQRALSDAAQLYQDKQAEWMQKSASDEETYRALEKARLLLHQLKAWDQVQTIADETNILATAASGFSIAPLQERDVPYVPSPYLSRTLTEITASRGGPTFDDIRMRRKEEEKSQQSTRVEQPVEGGRLVGKNGKIMRPFVITSGNEESRRLLARRQVFGTGQKLPTVTVEELARREYENRVKPDVSNEELDFDEDDNSVVDERTMKARQWDEFRESVGRGSGNTLNRG